jgi:hypothetical protein
MIGPGASVRSRRAERGGVSWVTALLLALLIGGGYLGWVWGPLYFELYAVKQVVRDYMNQAIKNRDDETLRRNMVLKLRSLEQIDGVDAAGRPERIPAIQVDERQVQWERDGSAQPPTLHIAFSYEREVVYPIIDRADVAVFDVDLTSDLTRADWGPSR